MKKVLLLSDPASTHTVKWAHAIAARGWEVRVFGLTEFCGDDYARPSDAPGLPIQVVSLTLNAGFFGLSDGHVKKLFYLKALPALKRQLRTFQPDILHAHYATSYGLLGALSGFHPFLISIWGDDVFEFPKKSFGHAAVLRFNLARADALFSTSHIMAREVALYTSKPVTVVPFGVDLDRVRPARDGVLPDMPDMPDMFAKGDIVLGTVKALREKYGMAYLIEGFRLLTERYPTLPLRLLIAGKGEQEEALKQLTRTWHLDHLVSFPGWVPSHQVQVYYNAMAVVIFPSISDGESFGVAAIEAQACGRPVVVSDVGGLPEVVEDGVTGLVVPPKDAGAIADAVARLLQNPDMARTMGRMGRQRVQERYDWRNNADQMVRAYGHICQEETP